MRATIGDIPVLRREFPQQRHEFSLSFPRRGGRADRPPGGFTVEINEIGAMRGVLATAKMDDFPSEQGIVRDCVFVVDDAPRLRDTR